MSRHPFEPYKIKVVEPINFTTKEKRGELLKKYGYNLFTIPARYVLIDLLTDSGTSAMSQNQWAGIMIGDESYAGCENFYNLEKTVQEITGFKYVIPTHQGRSAENILFSVLVKKGDVVPSNTHFDTTAANIYHKGGIPLDLPIKDSLSPTSKNPFKGNIDIEKLEETIKRYGRKKIPLCIITITNNGVAGQPVSLKNIKDTRKILNKYNIPLFFDAARYAENAYFIKTREENYKDKTIAEISRELFSLADGCLMSAKKDGLVNIGGFIASNDERVAQRIKEIMVVVEGFPTYGGLAGRDLEVIARGLKEAQDESYLDARIGQVKYLADKLDENEVPIYLPAGGHAVYLDVKRFLPHIPQSRFPGQSLVVSLYWDFGIRSVEIGSVMFSHMDKKRGCIVYPKLELVRLAIPRRVYTQSHLDYVADSIIALYKKRKTLRGMKYEYEPPRLKHFLARFGFV